MTDHTWIDSAAREIYYATSPSELEIRAIIRRHAEPQELPEMFKGHKPCIFTNGTTFTIRTEDGRQAVTRDGDWEVPKRDAYQWPTEASAIAFLKQQRGET